MRRSFIILGEVYTNLCTQTNHTRTSRRTPTSLHTPLRRQDQWYTPQIITRAGEQFWTLEPQYLEAIVAFEPRLKMAKSFITWAKCIAEIQIHYETDCILTTMTVFFVSIYFIYTKLQALLRVLQFVSMQMFNSNSLQPLLTCTLRETMH